MNPRLEWGARATHFLVHLGNEELQLMAVSREPDSLTERTK
jgi:hypothetical protein